MNELALPSSGPNKNVLILQNLHFRRLELNRKRQEAEKRLYFQTEVLMNTN